MTSELQTLHRWWTRWTLQDSFLNLGWRWGNGETEWNLWLFYHRGLVSSPYQAMDHFSKPRLVLSFLLLEMPTHIFAGEADLGSWISHDSHIMVALMVKHLCTMQETWVWSLGQEYSLEKEMATHSSTLAWKIPWTEELGAGYCPWGRKESGTTERLHFQKGKNYRNS